MASITKAMTALVFLQDDPDFSREVTVERADVRAASTTFLRAKDRVHVGDLLHLLLIASDNAAARVLARISPTGSEGFIARMNETAKDLGLVSTRFLDPSGLNAGNVSSAYDISRLIVRATADERISAIMRKPTHSFATQRRTVNINNTNKLLDAGLDVRGGKTGFISKAGYCLATLLRLPQGDQVAVVVLGARSNAGRFMETRHIVNWVSQKAQNWLAAGVEVAQPEN
jgi:D-alanyl-D-alanine endopeptidase (penicillin-binding protein 7)